MIDKSGIGTGLKLWLIFFLSFFFLGYPIVVAIPWAIIGSLAGGVIASQVNIKTPPPMAKPIQKENGKTEGRFNWRKRLEAGAQGSASFFRPWGRNTARTFKSRR